MNPFVSFMASSTGRVIRVLAGAVLMAWGWFVIGGAAGILIGAVGLLPLAAGILDFCIFAPVFGAPLSGPKIRAAKTK